MYHHKNIFLKFMVCTLLTGCGSEEAVSLDIASELSQLLDATNRAIYEGRIR